MEIDSGLVDKAIKALVEYDGKKKEKSGSSSLLGGNSASLLVQVQLLKDIKNSVINPIRIPLKHSMFSTSEEDHTICLFCKTDDKKSIDEYLASNPVDGLSKVISLTQVKKLFAAFKDRKALLSEFTHFVCDERIFSHLINLLGKTFGKRNNFPIPIKYSKVSGIPEAVMKAVSATYMHLHGQNVSIKFGHLGMSPKAIAENVVQGLAVALPRFSQHGKTVHSVHIKLPDSPALPIYTKQQSEALEFVKKAAAGKEQADGNSASEAPVTKGKRLPASAEPAGPEAKKPKPTTATTTAATTTVQKVVAVKGKAGATKKSK